MVVRTNGKVTKTAKKPKPKRLTAADIIARVAPPAGLEEYIPEWDGMVPYHGLTVSQHDQFAELKESGLEESEARRYLLEHCCGFNEDTITAVLAPDADGAPVQRLIQAIVRHINSAADAQGELHRRFRPGPG